MLLAFTIGVSIFLLLFELLCFANAIEYPLDLGKFTHNKQKIVLCAINILFTMGILVIYLINPKAEKTIYILILCQLFIGFIYATVLQIFCRKQYYNNIINEIKRLNLDIDEDIVVLRRRLMENSDISCSIKDLQKAINLMTEK